MRKVMQQNISVNNSFIKKVLKALLMTLFHLIVFVVIYDAGFDLAPLVFDVTTRSDLMWGITVYFSLVVFGVLSTIMSVLFEWIEKEKYRYLILICACLAFLGLFINNIQYTLSSVA